MAGAGGPGYPVTVTVWYRDTPGVQPWVHLPMWLPADEARTAWDVDTTRARELGLPSRPLWESVADTWTWQQSAPRPQVPPGRELPGLPAELEAGLLAAR